MPIREKLVKRGRKAGITLQSDVISAFSAYFDLLKKWNQKVSLTSLPITTDGEEALDRLLIEPVLAALYLPKPPATLIDIGSGGGSPAIPLKIACPGVSLIMVESKARKAAFLREAVRQLRLSDVTVEASRFEELLVRPELHELADVVTLRAVRVETNLLDGIQALLKPAGALFLFRSGDPAGDSVLSTRFLQYEASYPLLPHLQSRLVVLRNVPRGTT